MADNIFSGQKAFNWQPSGLDIFSLIPRVPSWSPNWVPAQASTSLPGNTGSAATGAAGAAGAATTAKTDSTVGSQQGYGFNQLLSALGIQLGQAVRNQGQPLDQPDRFEIMSGSTTRLEDGSLMRIARRGDKSFVLLETKTPEGRDVGYIYELGNPAQMRDMVAMLRHAASPAKQQQLSQQQQRMGLFEYMQALPPEQRLVMMVLMYFLLSDLIGGLFGRNRTKEILRTSGSSGGGSGGPFGAPQGSSWMVWG